ncbi:hypothetical protein AAHA92_09743 [Salvia divinorum]|uniref:Uncharacterized protein n=1 Tax=Salvia divinorum TaxID=28513 RepID=A0ABD1HSF8_SALDI
MDYYKFAEKRLEKEWGDNDNNGREAERSSSRLTNQWNAPPPRSMIHLSLDHFFCKNPDDSYDSPSPCFESPSTKKGAFQLAGASGSPPENFYRHLPLFPN